MVHSWLSFIIKYIKVNLNDQFNQCLNLEEITTLTILQAF